LLLIALTLELDDGLAPILQKQHSISGLWVALQSADCCRTVAEAAARHAPLMAIASSDAPKHTQTSAPRAFFAKF